MSGSSVHHGKYRLLVQTIPDGELGVLRLKRRHGYHLEKTHTTYGSADGSNRAPAPSPASLPAPARRKRDRWVRVVVAVTVVVVAGQEWGGWGLHLEVFQFSTSVHGKKKKNEIIIIIIKQW